MTNLDKLKATLRRNGFETAAEKLEIHLRDVDEALHAWRDYPRSMDRWPTRISKPYHAPP